jgi:hypothetical protein
VAQDRNEFRPGRVLSIAKRPPEHGLCAENAEQLRGHRGARQEAHLDAGHLQRQVVRPVRPHPLEAREVRPEPQELLLVPGAVEPQDAHLLLVRDRERIQQQRADDAEDRRRAAGTERQREHRKRRIGGTAHEPSRCVSEIHDPALEHWSSWSHAVRAGLETCHASPPCPPEKRRQRAQRLLRRPPPCRGTSLPDSACLVLGLQVGEDLVTLGDRHERTEQAGDNRRQPFGPVWARGKGHPAFPLDSTM